MKFVAAVASLLMIGASAGGAPPPSHEVDMYLSGVCNMCQEKDIGEDPLLCAGFATPLCDMAEMTPGYCRFCDGYFEMHEDNGDRDECHMRVARFTESDTCVNIRVMEARAERARRDAAEEQHRKEEEDDLKKAQAAHDAQVKADEAEAAAAHADSLKQEAINAAAESAHYQDMAQNAKQAAKDASNKADKKARLAKEAAEEAAEERMEAVKFSDEANAAYEAALQHEAAAKAAYVAAVQQHQLLVDEANRLREIADLS